MKRTSQRLFRLWIRNKKFVAIITTLLFFSQSVGATTLVLIVSGNAVVFGADGKGVDAGIDGSHLTPVGAGTFEKIAILQDRILVSTSGIARISGHYDFDTWIKSLPIAPNASVGTVAAVIQKQCKPVFEGEWAYQLKHGNAPVTNLAGSKVLPMVTYYIGGNELAGPRVYSVEVYVNWVKKRLKQPILKVVYPAAKEVSQFKNILVIRRSSENGGMDQLFTANSDIQRKYLKLHNREVGAALYDESLDVDGMTKLARILLSVEIQSRPELFSFPISVCRSTPIQRPTCKAYDQ